MPNERIPRRQYESQIGKTRLKGLVTKVLHILARNTPFPHLRVTLYRWMGIHIGRQVSIGLDSYLDDQFAMAMNLEDDCRLAARVTTVVHDDTGMSLAGPGSIFKQGALILGHVAPITIRRGAIVQARAVLLPGIIVGEKAIVRPGAVVTRDVPPCSVVAGAPAKVIGSISRSLPPFRGNGLRPPGADDKLSRSQPPSSGADDELFHSQLPSPGAVDFSQQRKRKEEPNMSLLPPNYMLRAEYDARVRKSWLRLAYQYLMLCLARFTLPTRLRVALYRAMGANVGQDVYIGVDTYLDERYPELITFEDDSGPSFRSIYVTHGEAYDAEGNRIRYVAPIRVKTGAWSGSNTVVYPGVTIGEGAVVGSGSVITEDVPDYAVVVGNPAQVIKYRALPRQEPAVE